MPTQQKGALATQPTFEQLMESIQRLQVEFNSFQSTSCEQLVNFSIGSAYIINDVTTIIDDESNTSMNAHSPSESHVNSVLYYHTSVPIILFAPVPTLHVPTADAIVIHSAVYFASIDSFFYSSAPTLYRLGIG